MNVMGTLRTFVYTALSAMLLLSAIAETHDFTPAEKQQINIATPGLFAKSKSFAVDFSAIKDKEYSFPLPVGTAVATARGLEITTRKGDAVKAMFAGTVRLSRQLPGYGNVIVVRHSNGLETVYGNNSGNIAKVGDHVKAGQTIAIAGGEGETARLVFEIMVNGCNVNPQTLLAIKSHKLYRRQFTFTDNGRFVKVESSGGETEVDEDENAVVDLNRELSASEQGVVSAATPDLFAKSSTITINFAEYGDGEWCYPLKDAKVISPYGGKRRHSGVDLKTTPNDAITAAFAGKVRFAKRYGGYGNVIVIRHASGLETLYSHNSKNLVKAGDWVKAGQDIALTGRTGRATTEHLHFEIRINGRAYNPQLIYDHANHRLKRVKLVANKNGKISVETVK
jgi:murein DD-endopeptidase MepM/ murein hydrolase activator NlpD